MIFFSLTIPHFGDYAWGMLACPQRFFNGMKFHDNECFNLMFAALLFVESVIDVVCFP